MNTDKISVLIIGAGGAGSLIAQKFTENDPILQKYECVGFVDDKTKIGSKLFDFTILGLIDHIPDLVLDYDIDILFYAIASDDGKVLRRVVELVSKTDAQLRTFPPIHHFLEVGGLGQLRKVQPEDLLRKKPITFDYSKEKLKNIINKVILVTGAAGSVGSEIVAQLCGFNIKRLICLDCAESNLFNLENNLKELFPNIELIFFLGDLRNKDTIDRVFKLFSPEIVFHAAAYKHVTALERNPEQAILNNIIGAKNILESSIEYNIKIFVQISTDKAVNPASIMGLSKNFIEYMIKAYATKTTGKFLAVRFGNVLESNGSVIPIFKKQIENGGPVTITDEKMTRYFMTRTEAAQLVIHSAILGQNNNLYVLNMGKPYSIKEVAEDLIRLYGYRPNQDIQIKTIGIRAGEKLEEKLFKEFEQKTKINPYIFQVKSKNPKVETIFHFMDELINLVNPAKEMNVVLIKKALLSIVTKLDLKSR